MESKGHTSPIRIDRDGLPSSRSECKGEASSFPSSDRKQIKTINIRHYCIVYNNGSYSLYPFSCLREYNLKRVSRLFSDVFIRVDVNLKYKPNLPKCSPVTDIISVHERSSARNEERFIAGKKFSSL